MVPLWQVVEPLGCGIALEKVVHWAGLEDYSLASITVCSLLPVFLRCPGGALTAHFCTVEPPAAVPFLHEGL